MWVTLWHTALSGWTFIFIMVWQRVATTPATYSFKVMFSSVLVCFSAWTWLVSRDFIRFGFKMSLGPILQKFWQHAFLWFFFLINERYGNFFVADGQCLMGNIPVYHTVASACLAHVEHANYKSEYEQKHSISCRCIQNDRVGRLR